MQLAARTPVLHAVAHSPSLTPCPALPRPSQGEPLRKYFYGLYSQAELNAFEANMFLAEDRILCIEVVAKKVRPPPYCRPRGAAPQPADQAGCGPRPFDVVPRKHVARLTPAPPAPCLFTRSAPPTPTIATITTTAHPPTHPPSQLPFPRTQGCNYRLEYIKEAVAEADAVTKLTGLMKQRRRWLNGTFFAMLYALGNMGRIWTESSHSVMRKLVLTGEFLYLIVNMIVGTW